MVSLGGTNVRDEGIGFQDVFSWIGKHQGLSLALVDFEIRVQISSEVQVGEQLSLSGTHDKQMASSWDNSTSGNLKFVDVVHVVAQEVAAQIHCCHSRIVKLNKVLIVPSNAQRIVAARKLVDHHLSVCSKCCSASKGQQPQRFEMCQWLHVLCVIGLQNEKQGDLVHLKVARCRILAPMPLLRSWPGAPKLLVIP